MKLVPGSIKGRLLLWLFSFASLLLIALGFFLYNKIGDIVISSVDDILHSQTQLIVGLLHEEDGGINLELSEVISGEYSIPRSGHYYKVLINGEPAAISHSLVSSEFNLASGKIVSGDEKLGEKIYLSVGPDNEPLRVLQHDLDFMGQPVSIFTAESLRESLSMINRFRYFLFIIIPLSILTGGLVSLWITKKSLDPLSIFSSKIETITHKTLNERIETEAEARELIGIASSFNKMLERLQSAFDAEKRLIADASHELKTPLSVIKTKCDVLLQKDRTTDEYTAALNTIRHTSDTMKKIVEDMLSLARLDSGILSSGSFQMIPIKNILEKAVQLAGVLAGKTGVKINPRFRDAEDMDITGDQNTLTEAFLNVIENAVRYNKPGGAVDVALSKNRGHITVMIKDTGSGIRRDDMDRIFDRFYRSDVSRSVEGSGLGLSIAKAIIEAHNGGIKAESEAGHGSCFTIILPA
jgi:heavy metal sensor kinase